MATKKMKWKTSVAKNTKNSQKRAKKKNNDRGRNVIKLKEKKKNKNATKIEGTKKNINNEMAKIQKQKNGEKLAINDRKLWKKGEDK